ncbi:hypothetical protein V8G54_036053 [Vigna mungo]|uniref:Transposase (putative) gypsy type domain-containing protein n=1 Tax=Vigna mungo TaxID=3915 RepID=A0AAQ3MHQ7_VIGMU
MFFFTQLHVQLPLYEFTMKVLHILNVARTQLHPNGWASLHAFCAIRILLKIDPTPHVFLHFYSTRPRVVISWCSCWIEETLQRLHKKLFTTLFNLQVKMLQDLSIVSSL